MHILLITRHYPPEISGGARRPSLYVDGLRKLGHRVTIVSPFRLDDPESICVPNKAIEKGMAALNESAMGTKYTGFTTQLKAKIRMWLYWPDDNIKWVRDVIKCIKRENVRPDWIMTTSPPESIHIAGQKLSQYISVPWVAELRDTWLEEPHRAILSESIIRKFVERRIALNVLGVANAIICVSDAVMLEARSYVEPGLPECVIGHFSDTPPEPYKFDDTKLNLIHTGGFTLSDRRRKLATLIKKLETYADNRQNLVLHIAGPLSADEVATIKSTTVSVEWHGLVSLSKAKAMQAGADALLLCTPQNSHALPGKYAEYARTGKPIFYIGGGNWLNLVDDQCNLIPLEQGFSQVTKGSMIATPYGMTHIEAAEKLVKFLAKVKF